MTQTTYYMGEALDICLVCDYEVTHCKCDEEA